MPKTEEIAVPIAVTKEEIEVISKCFKFTGSDFLNDWESSFIESLYKRQKEGFVLLLSIKQRHHLTKIWEKLYDQGLIT